MIHPRPESSGTRPNVGACRALASAVFAAVLAGGALGAQPSLARGTRARVVAPDSALAQPPTVPIGWHLGTIDSVTTSAIVFAPEGGGATVKVPLARVSRIDVSAGRVTHPVAGALVGGALSGAAFVGMVCSFSNGSCDVNRGNVGGFLAYLAVGAIPGVAIGRLVGGRIDSGERWRAVWPER